jgi:hypothetical protein
MRITQQIFGVVQPRVRKPSGTRHSLTVDQHYISAAGVHAAKVHGCVHNWFYFETNAGEVLRELQRQEWRRVGQLNRASA